MKANATGKRIVLGLLVAALAAPAAQAATRPDDRPGPRGVNVVAVVEPAASPMRPDNRPGPLGVGQIGADEPATTPLRPDNRPGPVGIGDVQFVPVTAGDGFDWGDAGIGVISGFGLALALTGGLLLVLRRVPLPHRTGSAPTG